MIHQWPFPHRLIEIRSQACLKIEVAYCHQRQQCITAPCFSGSFCSFQAQAVLLPKPRGKNHMQKIPLAWTWHRTGCPQVEAALWASHLCVVAARLCAPVLLCCFKDRHVKYHQQLQGPALLSAQSSRAIRRLCVA